MPNSAASAEVLRFGLRTTGQALGDPAGADVHHRAVRLAAHLQEIGVSGSGFALHIDHLGIPVGAWLSKTSSTNHQNRNESLLGSWRS